MNDLDIEELESRLYGQVYHSLTEENQQENVASLPSSDSIMRKPVRYFGAWSPGSKFLNKNGRLKSNNLKSVLWPHTNRNKGSFSKNVNKLHKSDGAINEMLVINPNSSQFVCMNSKISKSQWKQKRKLKQSSKFQKNIDQKQVQAEESVIILSDSEDEACFATKTVSKLRKIEKESSKKTQEDKKVSVPSEDKVDASCDEVVFIEPAPIEVINLDEDKSAEIESSTLHYSNTKDDAIYLDEGHRELLRTPDSASNDFINGSGLELDTSNFNFGLHGLDFRHNFIKSTPTNERCETESSSSTTEANSVNLIKTTVFNEVEFPKEDIFSENNLENFGNFITPFREETNQIAQSSSIINVQSSQQKIHSGSSSESEAEESTIGECSQNINKLSFLSPMQGLIETPQPNKSKKKITSKFDLLNLPSTSGENKTKNVKKKKKSKKKHREVGEISEPLKFNKRPSLLEGDPEISLKKKHLGTHQECSNFLQNSELATQVLDTSKPVETHSVNSNSPNNEVAIIELNDRNNVPPAETVSGVINILENKVISVKTDTHTENLENVEVINLDSVSSHEAFQDLTHLSSDSESVVSSLKGEPDIQLNFKGATKTQLNSEVNAFDVENIHLSMSSDPSLWAILDTDKYSSPKNKGRRCHRCKQYGHIGIRCPKKFEVKCALCGGEGHFEPRCPNKICTQCGRKSQYSTTYCRFCFKYREYICEICAMVGHDSAACPDLWRRYHLTTKEGPLVAYNGPDLKPRDQLWCSGCARSGHLEHLCRFHKSIYPRSDPYVKSYEDIYSGKLKERSEIQTNDEANARFNTNFTQQGNHITYNQSNFSQSDNYLIEPSMIGANRGQYLRDETSDLRYSLNNSRHNQFIVDDPLPNFISFEEFDERLCTNQQTSNLVVHSEDKRRNNSIFFSSSAPQLQQFINAELHRLSRLSHSLNSMIKDIRRRQVPKYDRGEDYEKLNMVLFGIFNFIDGKMHLEMLKQFRRTTLTYRLNYGKRRKLHKSYCYIFGRNKHFGVDYNELLRRI